MPLRKNIMYCKLDVITKIIAFIFTIVFLLTSIVYGILAGSLPIGDAKTIFYTCFLVVSIIEFVFSCLMIYGILRGKPKFFWPWIITSWFFSVSFALTLLVGFIWEISNAVASTDGYEINTTVVSVTLVYMLFCVTLFACACVVNKRRAEVASSQAYEPANKPFNNDDENNNEETV